MQILHLFYFLLTLSNCNNLIFFNNKITKIPIIEKGLATEILNKEV